MTAPLAPTDLDDEEQMAPEARWASAGRAVILIAALVAYANSFAGVFVFDDTQGIAENPSIRRLGALHKVLWPPHNGETVSGRPVLNLSLAVNYAMGGLDVWGYHAMNLAIHAAVGVVLLEILRRTFLRPNVGQRFQQAAGPLAFTIALFWTLHPLQTESVTYIMQRAESLVGLFYLLTLYCTIRGAESDAPAPWYRAAVAACLLGMGTKEVMATAPVVVLLYDRTFLAGSFREAWRLRRGFYLGLMSSWILLAGLVLSTGLIFRRAEVDALGWWPYLRSQPEVILYYLRLSLWPHPLCLDYEWPVACDWSRIAASALALGLLGAATLWALRKREPIGMLGAWFFLILAPSSSIVPTGQLAYEHRMYLPLAAVLALVVCGGYELLDRLLRKCFAGPDQDAARKIVLGIVVAAIAMALGGATIRRNFDYRSLVSIWQDTLDKRPENYRAHSNLGWGLAREGRYAEAAEHYREAIRLKDKHPAGWINLAKSLARDGKMEEALACCEEGLQRTLKSTAVNPRHLAEVHSGYGLLLSEAGKTSEAIQHLEEAIRLNPEDYKALNNLGLILAKNERLPEAMERFEQAQAIMPDDAMIEGNLGAALRVAGRPSEAIGHLRESLRLEPDNADTHYQLGVAWRALGNPAEAFEHLQEALRLKSDHAEALNSLGNIFATSGKASEAAKCYQRVIELQPDAVDARLNLAWLLATRTTTEKDDAAQAIALAEKAGELARQRSWHTLDVLAAAYASAGRYGEAVSAAQQAIELAAAAKDTDRVQKIQTRLKLYRTGRPYRE